MAQRTLAAQMREEVGKGAARRLRRNGRIPAVVYGHQENHLVSIDAHEFGHKFKRVSESTIITLETPEKSLDVLVKDYQEDLVGERIVHIDFFEIERGKLLRTHVRLQAVGNAVGEKEGGIRETQLHEVEIESLPKDLPEQITYDISNLEIGHSVHVRDLVASEGVRILNAPDQTVCLVAMPRVEVEEKEEEEGIEEEAVEAEAGEAEEQSDE